MRFNHIDYSNKYLEDILYIIRKGIIQKKQMLKKQREGLNSQLLVKTFNVLGTASNMKTWIGVQKEHEQEKGRGKEDIYFYLNDDNHTCIFYVEAKRLPKDSTRDDEEYVTGISSTGKPSGGIQRYKLAIHGDCNLRHNGIIAYIESKSINEWLQIINLKISKEYPNDSFLIPAHFENEYTSTHTYQNSEGNFLMHHFLINLTKK